MTPSELTQFSESWMGTVGQIEQADASGNAAQREDGYETQITLLRQLAGLLANVSIDDRTQMARLVLAAKLVYRMRGAA